VTLDAQGLVANNIPMLLRPTQGAYGTLVGHVARANPVWHATNLEVQTLAIFQGSQHYVSPGWYATKQEHGKVVPTWNYVVVQARGSLIIHDDADWVRQQVTELTQQQESAYANPWAVQDAPRDYTDALVRALVGIEIPITSLTGKWKVSQNQPAANQAGVVKGLEQQGGSVAMDMAALVAAAAKKAQ